MERKVGKVTHYYNKLGVAAIELDSGEIMPGDHLHIVGHTTDADVIVETLELDHTQIREAHEGQNIGVKVNERVREHDEVYKSYI